MSDRQTLKQIERHLKKIHKGIYITPKYDHRGLYFIGISNVADVIDLSFLQQFKSLNRLAMVNNHLDKLDLSSIATIESLNVVEIRDNQFLKEINIKPLVDLPNLHYLSMNRNAFKFIDLQIINQMESLERLDLKEISGASNTRTMENLIYYDYWHNKRYYQDCEDTGYSRYDLDLEKCHSFLKEFNMRFLEGHPSLIEADLSLNDGVSKFILPRKAPEKIKEIELSDNRLEEVKIKHFISEKTNKISISRSHVNNIDLDGLEICKNLLSLSLKHNKIENIDLSSLRNMSELVALELSRNRLKGIDLTPLSSLYNLRLLDLESNDLKFVNLDPLIDLSNLQILRLGDNLIERINLKPLKNVKSLKTLRLTRNKLTEIDLEPLRPLKYLQKFQIARNKLQSLTLEPLRGKVYMNEINLDRNEFEYLNIEALEDIPHVDFIDLTDATTKSRVDITSILSHQNRSWVKLGEQLKLNVDVDKIKDIEIQNSHLIESKAVEEAIDFKKNSKKLLNSKTEYFAIKAIENHDDTEDLLIQRLLENRVNLSSKISKRLKDLNQVQSDEEKNV
jgi:Leucine-rich repeat (LRR) protein